MKAGILTISDKGHRGDREDTSGPAIREFLATHGIEEVVTDIVPDESDDIKDILIKWTDLEGVSLILTTGGTGFAARDVTPEATRAAIDREAPGFCETMRAESLKITPHAMLSRAVSGIRKSTLIINLPGSRKAVLECLEIIWPAIPHALELLSGTGGECGRA